MDKNKTNQKKLINILKSEERNRIWLSRKLGVSHSLVCYWYKGERTISDVHKLKICKLFNLNNNYFI